MNITYGYNISSVACYTRAKVLHKGLGLQGWTYKWFYVFVFSKEAH